MFGMIYSLYMYIKDGQVFSWLVTLTGTSGLLTWMSISVTHLRFRKAFVLQKRSVNELPFHAVGMPFGNYVAIFIGIVIICGQVSCSNLNLY